MSVEHPLEGSQGLEFVFLDEFKTPDKLISERVKQGFSVFINQLFSSPEENYYDPSDLKSFSSSQINRLVPYPDWYQLKESESGIDFSEHSAILILDFPFSGTTEIVKKLLHDKSYTEIYPPSITEILQDAENYLKGIKLNQQEDIVIYNLESWFRRHHNGYSLIRKLMERLKNHQHRIIITCNSWSFEFLIENVGITFSHFRLMALQSSSQLIVQEWLLDLTLKTATRKLIYRSSRTGDLIFERQTRLVKESLDIPIEEEIGVDGKFLKNLVSYSMGLRMVIWEIWRNALRIQPDDNFDIDETEHDKIKHLTVWVVPWDQITLPNAPLNLQTELKIILHSLLIHNGMKTHEIDQIVQFGQSKTSVYLGQLQKLGLIKDNEDNTTLNPIVYPRIRNLLKSSGFLVDRRFGEL